MPNSPEPYALTGEVSIVSSRKNQSDENEDDALMLKENSSEHEEAKIFEGRCQRPCGDKEEGSTISEQAQC